MSRVHGRKTPPLRRTGVAVASFLEASAGADGFDVAPNGTAKRLSLLPVIVAGVALALSAALVFVRLGTAGPFIGWILTPFVVVGCLAWGRALFVSNSSDPWFDRPDGRRKLLILQLMTLVGFVLSLPHVWRIGQEVALWLQ